MPNTSASGGYLQPNVTPAPLEGQALNAFLQQVVAGITGLAGTLVRPRWQAEPPNIPDAATAWCAIGIASRPADTFPWTGFLVDTDHPQGAQQLQRHEQLNLLCSFYDLGTNGLADQYAALLRDGLAIPQNREVLTSNGMGLNSVGELTTVPSLLKNRWLYRVDLLMVVSRQITRDYPVEYLTSMQGVLAAQEADADQLTLQLEVEAP